MNDLEQKKIEAEIANLQAQTAKIEAERKNITKSWHDFVIETVKITGALILGAGGAIATITGYQAAEVKREKIELEITRNNEQLQSSKKELKDNEKQIAIFNKQKIETQQQLSQIKIELASLQENLKQERDSQTSNNKDIIDKAIATAEGIESKVDTTSDKLQSSEQKQEQYNNSKYLVGVQTLGVTDEKRLEINQKIKQIGYSLHHTTISYSVDNKPSWLAAQSTVLYYATSALPVAKQLALEMKAITGENFDIQRGNGFGIEKDKKDIRFVVHYIKK
jgi:chromosome segregation ATPase